MSAGLKYLFIIFSFGTVGCAEGVGATLGRCPPYTGEGLTLTCVCAAQPSDSNAQITWPGHSGNATLTVTNVRRTDNGTRYTCLVQVNGTNSTVVYTLQVVYGPAQNTIRIEGPSPFVTDWKRSLTLTCKAEEVNPVEPGVNPLYSWSGVVCSEGFNTSTCTFKPDPRFHDGRTVNCTVYNRYAESPAFVQASFTVNLTYPPQWKPVITHFPSGNIARTGDNLTCTVQGGKPLVSAVDFRCTNPALADQPDFVNQSAVSSPLTIDTSRAVGVDTECVCSAVWEPAPYYVETTTIVLQLQYSTSVLSLTLNNIEDRLIVSSNGTDVHLKCIANGRPAPTLTLLSLPSKRVLAEVTKAQEVWTIISNTRCGDMETFACVSDNGLATADEKRVALLVQCGATPEAKSRVDGLPVSLVAGGAAGGVLVLVIAVIVVVAVRRRNGHGDRTQCPKLKQCEAYNGLQNPDFHDLDPYSTIKNAEDGKDEKSPYQYDVIGTAQNVYDEVPTSGKGSKKEAAAKVANQPKGSNQDTTYLYPVNKSEAGKGGDGTYLHPVSKENVAKGVDNNYLQPVDRRVVKGPDDTYLHATGERHVDAGGYEIPVKNAPLPKPPAPDGVNPSGTRYVKM